MFDLDIFQYRDIVRQFIKGSDGFSGAFAECLCGSPNLYQVFLFLFTCPSIAHDLQTCWTTISYTR